MTIESIRQEIIKYESAGLTPECVYIGRKDYLDLRRFAKQALFRAVHPEEEFNQVFGLDIVVVDREHYLSIGVGV